MIEPENLTLRLLRSIDGKLDRVHDDVKDIKVRITAVDEALAGRLDRIERRLELVDG
jgi:hypothetical protein